MRAKIFFVPLVILGFLSLSAAQSTDPELLEGRVIIVPDGDEVRLKTNDGKTYPVRIHGIDSPEKDQDYGTAARRALESLVLDKDVKVVVHRKDSEGRYMGTIFREGQDIGVVMLENGSAWHYKRVSGEQTSEGRVRYAKAELRAREAKAGLWAAAMPMPPWEFREEAEGAVSPATKSDLASAPRVQQTAVMAPETTSSPATPDSKGGRTYHLGPRGGCYYMNSSGSKVYVKDKSLCSKP